MAWKSGRRFKAGNGQTSDFCQMFGRFFVHGDRMILRMEICENLRYNSIVESEQQIGFCQSVIEDHQFTTFLIKKCRTGLSVV